MNAADYLYPSELSVTPAPIRKVLITGSCMAVEYHRHLLGLGVESDYIAINGFAEPPPPPAPIESYDVQIVQLALREVVTDRVIAFAAFADAQSRRAIVAEAEESLRLRLAACLRNSRAHGTLTFVCNFLVPQLPVTASLGLQGTDGDLRWLVRRLNDVIAETVADYPSAYLSDIDALAATIGKRHVQDDVVHFYTHNSSWGARVQLFDTSAKYNAPPGGRIEAVPPLLEIYPLQEQDFLAALWRQWLHLFRVVNQVDQVKLVVFDLDDTLWRGQIAEHYGEEAWPVPHGWPLGLWEAVHHLKARGILTAVCSKNEESLVRERWSRAVMDGWLSLDDFTFLSIGWRPKAESIAEIIRAASLTPKSVVCVDDNPVERAAIAAALPGVRVLGANPYLVRRILLWSSETQVARLTGESRNRDAMMRQQQARERERASLSRDEFLAGLNCRVHLRRLAAQGSDDYPRALELLNKTNQFNTTGKRWTSAEAARLFAAGGCFYVFEVEDKFTRYGLVGVVVYEAGRFAQFAMSCRVLGLEIEDSVVNAIMAVEGADIFTAEVAETSTNMVSRGLYERCGFEREPGRPGAFRRTGRGIAEPARHLTLHRPDPMKPRTLRFWTRR